MIKPTPNPPDSDPATPSDPIPSAADINATSRKLSTMFIVNPELDTETLLADDVDDSRRCIALAISRMADGVQLLVERALDRLEAQETAAG